QLSRGHLPCNGAGSVGDLGTAPVVDAHRESHRRVIARQLFRVLKFRDDGLPQFGTTPGPPHANAPLMHLVAAATDDISIESHEKTHLIRASLPVLRAECISADMAHADLNRACH